MNNEEIEELIAALRSMLDENGFGWARDQVDSAADLGSDRRRLAHALLEAAEIVTIDLAEAELAMLNAFDTAQIAFLPDEGADDEDRGAASDQASTSREADEPEPTPQRRGVIQDLLGMRPTFQALKEQIDVSD